LWTESKEARSTKKPNEWILSKGRADNASNRQNQLNAAPIVIQDKETLKPTALTFIKADMLFVANEVEKEILQLKAESNGVTITATVLGKVECPKRTFGIAAIYNHVYVSSTHRSLGGIISYDYNNKQQKFTNPSEPPNRLISNGTAECKTAHGVAVLSSAEEASKLVFTEVSAKKVKCLLLGEDVLTVEFLSGTGTGGRTHGAKATFSQPTSCYTEASTKCLCQ